MAVPNADQQDEITFLTGVNKDGQIVSDTYYTYNSGVDTKVFLNKWYNDDNGKPLAPTTVAGTPGGTVTYGFSADLGPRARLAYANSLKLWSDIADITFKEVSDPTKANIQFVTETATDGYTFIPNNGIRPAGVGRTDIPSQASPDAVPGGQAKIGLNGPDSAFNNIDPANTYLFSNVTHEEGHVLGLGHSGAYNGADRTPDSQRSPYDTQSYSIMSYYNPSDTSAKYFAQYPNPDTVFNWQMPQTPMMLDVEAMQRLYGVSKSSTFAGGQTYGFNTNIDGASRGFYDFTVNKQPVLTLYNKGTNNTLDLSGFSTDSTINLNPGTFSSASADGLLQKNIAIALNTRIDKAIGGAGNDTFRTNGNGDTIDGGAGSDTVIITGNNSDYSINIKGGGEIDVVKLSDGTVDKLTNIESIQFAVPVCFTTGALIRTRRGDVAVEELTLDDQVVTASGRLRPIVWIGRREVRCTRSTAPVRILADAFGPGRPARDLYLSPGHPVLVGADEDNEGGVLVPVMCLINGTTIVRTPRASVTYWHIELDAHDILLAEGLPAESYIDGGDRAFFVEASDHALHNPDFIPPGWHGRCRPVMTDGPVVEAERARLDRMFAMLLDRHARWPETLAAFDLI